MRLIILISAILTGCASSNGHQYSAGDFLMMFLQAKANSTLTRDSYNRGLSSQYNYQPQQQYQYKLPSFEYIDKNYGAGVVQ